MDYDKVLNDIKDKLDEYGPEIVDKVIKEFKENHKEELNGKFDKVCNNAF